MKSPQTLPRRLVPAIAVTAVAALVLGAVASAASGEPGEEQPAPQLPATFGVASPMIGDAWRYDVTLDGAWTFAGPAMTGMDNKTQFGRYGWAESRAVRGADGLLHDANLLVGEALAYEPYTWNDEFDYDYDCEFDDDGDSCSGIPSLGDDPYWSTELQPVWQLAGTNKLLQAFEAYAGNDTFTNYGIPPLGIGASVTHISYVHEFVDFEPTSTNCFAINALQGGVIPTTNSLELFQPCSMGGFFLTLPKGLYFTAKSIEEVAGVQTVRYEAALNGTYVANFAPGIPYPVRFSFDLPSMKVDIPEETDDYGSYSGYYEDHLDLPGARSAVLDLAGFRPGTEPLDVLDDTANRAPAPAFVMAPRLPWGMSDTGIVHPFPLSEAYKVAQNATEFSNLRTYQIAHPESYVAAADYEEFVGDDGLDRTWRIGMTDGQEPFGFSVTKGTHDRFVPVAARPVLDEQLNAIRKIGNDNKVPLLYEFDSYGGPPFDWYNAPARSKVPSEFPTVASAAARWAAFDGSGTAMNTWGFYIGCKDFDAPCDQPSLQIVVGNTHLGWNGIFIGQPLPGDPFGMSQSAYTNRLVEFNSDGSAIVMVNDDDRQNTTAIMGNQPPVVPDPPAPSNAGAGNGFDLASDGIQGVPPSPWLPGPKEATGIGFIAILVGALYWLWPKLKILAFLGLFSRLKTDDLLDHPARAQLSQLIEAQPGVHLTELQRRSGLPNGTLAHHLDKLRAGGLVVGRPMGGYTCYFPRGTKVDPAAPAMKSEGARQIMEAVRKQPGLSNLEVAHLTGLQPSTVNYHVTRLAEAGAVGVMRNGRSVRLHAMRA